MRSPFPGMDPYLEDRHEWSSVHTWLITAIAGRLAEAIAPHFYVRIEQRVYISAADDPDAAGRGTTIVPDIYTARQPVAVGPMMTPAGTITPPTILQPEYEPEVRDRFLEIRDTQGRNLVTTIELLSPFNKVDTYRGYQAFREMREKVFQSPVHWLEIDLLREGRRPREVAGKSDCYVLLRRGEPVAPFEVWYIDLRDRLPTIAVPLQEPYADVPLDLQSVFAEMYGRAQYAYSIDYNRPVPGKPLKPADAAWARNRIDTWYEELTAHGSHDAQEETHADTA